MCRTNRSVHCTSTDTYAIMNCIFYVGNSKSCAVFAVQTVLFFNFCWGFLCFVFFSKVHLSKPNKLLRSGILLHFKGFVRDDKTSSLSQQK